MTFSFITAAAKHLSMVEIDCFRSNQHEFNGVASLKRMFGPTRQHFVSNFSYYDDHGLVCEDFGQVTWYDAREDNHSRTEYRLYYTGNQVVYEASVNDLLIVGKLDNQDISIIIAKNGSSYYHLLMNLFGIKQISSTYIIRNQIAL